MTSRALTAMSDRRPASALVLHRKTQKYLGLTAASLGGGSVACLRLAAVLALTLGLLWGDGAAVGTQADDAGPSPAAGEHLVKAAFLYNFAKFTDWPDEAFADAAAPLRICALGHESLGPALASLEGKKIRGRQVEAARLESHEQVGGCHLVYIGVTAREHLQHILERLEGRPVLTVTEMPSAGEPGGMINLVVVAQKIRFHIDPAVAQSAGLSFSSKLLALSADQPAKVPPTAEGSKSAELPNG